MEQAADQWIETSEATALIVALACAPEWGRNQIARDQLHAAYLAGYQDGQKRTPS